MHLAKPAFTCLKWTMETPVQCVKSFLWTDFTHHSDVSIIDFEQVNVGWKSLRILVKPLTSTVSV